MQISMVGWLLSNIGSRRVARVYSIVAGVVVTLVQAGSLFAGSENTMHYIYFSIVEMATSIVIVVLAVRWKAAAAAAAETRDGELVAA